MSVARPLARLLPRASRLLPRASRPNAASFSSTPLRPFPRQRPSAVITTAARLERARPYTAEEVRELSEHYTPPQLSALLVGEEAIAPEDIARASQRRNDAMALPYIDDLSSISPVLDHVPGPLLGKAKVDKEGYPIPRQPLPKIEDPAITWPDADVEGEQLRTLAAHTGFSVDQLRNMRSKTMVVHSVVNQTRMGKIRKIYVLSIAGNGNGLLGIGEGKATETEDAIRRAGYMALRNMEPIHRYEGRTIFGNVEVKVGAVEMKLFTRPPGTSPLLSPLSYIHKLEGERGRRSGGDGNGGWGMGGKG